MYICNCIVHVSHNFVFAITVNCLYSCFLCVRALSTQQGGYVRATNLYYYYYYIVKKKLLQPSTAFSKDLKVLEVELSIQWAIYSLYMWFVVPDSCAYAYCKTTKPRPSQEN